MNDIEIVPKWQAVLPILLAALTDGTEEAKRIAREELERMAVAADRAAELQNTFDRMPRK